MARLKFLIFVVAAFAVALFGLARLSERSASLSRAQTEERLRRTQELFELRLRLAQAEATAALTAVATEPTLVQSLSQLPQDAPPTPAAVEIARVTVLAALQRLPEPLRNPTLLLVGSAQGVLALPPGDGEPTTASDPNAFGLVRAAGAGVEGGYGLAQAKLYRVAAVGVRAASAPSDAVPLATIGVAYRLDEAFVNAQAADLGVSVTLLARGTSVSSLSKTARAQVIGGADGPIALGALPALGPVQLPLFAGDLTPSLRHSFPLAGVENGRAVFTAELRGLRLLAGLQQRACAALGVLLLLGVVVLVLLRAPRQAPLPAAEASPASRGPTTLGVEGNATVVEPAAPEEAPAAEQPSFLAGGAPAAEAAPMFEAPEPALSNPPMAAEPSPFEAAFAAPPAAAEAAAALPEPAPAFDAPASLESPFGASAPVPLPSAEPVAPAAPAPAHSAGYGGGANPFEPVPLPPQAAASLPPLETVRLPAPEQESTVVAAVPEQLLRAAARVRPHAETPASLAGTAAAAAAAGASAVPLPAPEGPDADEVHFQAIFEQFLATRAECSEPAEGLTYERFAAKLRKNREALMQKYGCRSVRFHVYVKEGKAALKASPVRD